MRTKRIWWLSAVVLLCLSFLLFLPVHAEESSEEAPPDPVFAGERSVVYEIDSGLLPNYLVGGRTALDGYLRVYKPAWLSVDFTVQERTISMNLSFSFASVQEYRDELAELSLRSPVLLYEEGTPVTYCENLTADDLLNFLHTPMKKNGALGSIDFSKLFRPKGGTFVLNGETYEASSPLCINRTPAVMTASGILIRTTAKKDGLYERTVLVSVPQEDVTDTVIALWEGQMSPLAEEITSNTQGTVHQFGVSFTAAGAEQLAQKTMQALNVSDTATETLRALDDQNVQVTLQESLDLEPLMDPATGDFTYTFTLGDGCDTLLVPSDLPLIVVDDQVETSDAAQASNLAVSYHRPFGFSSLSVTTDLTDPMGKIGRTIRYTVPLTVAEAYHQKVTNALGNALVRGQTLEIYDTAEERCYEIHYQSWFPKQLTEMTRAQFPAVSMELTRARFPFLTSRFHQTLGAPDCAYSTGIETVTWQVLLPDGTKVTSGEAEGESAAETLAWQDISRRSWISGAVLTAAGLLVVAVILRSVIALRRRWKKFLARKAAAKLSRTAPKAAVPAEKVLQPVGGSPAVKPGTEAQPAAESQPCTDDSLMYCEMCGAPLRAGQKFCGRCGHKRP